MASRSTYAFESRIDRCVAVLGTLLLSLSLHESALASDRSHRSCAEPEPLKDALLALGLRTGATLTYDSESLPRVNVCPVDDEREIAAALAQMLADTGLIATPTGALAYRVHPAPV